MGRLVGDTLSVRDRGLLRNRDEDLRFGSLNKALFSVILF